MTSETPSGGLITRLSAKNGLLSAITAVVLVLSVPALLYLAGTGALTISGGALFGLFALLATMGGVRLFGKDTLAVVRQARGKSE